MRFLRTAAFALLSLSGLHAFGQALTTITATQVYGGPTAITGTLCFTPVDKYGNNIAVSKSGGGYYAPGRPFCGTLTSGALTASLSVPNSATDSPAGHDYAMTIVDTVNHLTYAPVIISGISGTTWSLDTYAPNVSVSTAAAFTYTTGAGAPTGVCTAPAIYGQTNGALWQCITGAWVQIVAGSSFAYISNLTSGGQATCTPDGTNLTACTASSISSTELGGMFTATVGLGSSTNLIATLTLPVVPPNGDICSASLFDASANVVVPLYADGLTVHGSVAIYALGGQTIGTNLLSGGGTGNQSQGTGTFGGAGFNLPSSDTVLVTYTCVRASPHP